MGLACAHDRQWQSCYAWAISSFLWAKHDRQSHLASWVAAEMALALRLSKYLLSSPGMSRSSEMLALMTLHPKGICKASRAGRSALSYLHRGVTALLHLPPAVFNAIYCFAEHIDPCFALNGACKTSGRVMLTSSFSMACCTFIRKASLPLKISITSSVPAVQPCLSMATDGL